MSTHSQVAALQSAKKHKWRTTKSQELFAFLFHHREEWVSKEILLDKLYDSQAGVQHESLSSVNMQSGE
ncbi:hypothetical protein [Paenibacillus xylanexedens]|uniref:hypothetical protein n=1 Tax=Paenibacillus xylanexedens TaxID=528191 RepID=UPI001643177E|nr:hypothetical protein [Paenibacillus xylanexedens]